MQALIDPTTSVQYVSEWVLNPDQTGQKYLPIFTTIPNSQRVCEVAQEAFPVAPPLFWTECANDVVADQWYYDSNTQQILQVPPDAPYPQQSTSGLQSV